jgi:hypothetical protein
MRGHEPGRLCSFAAPPRRQRCTTWVFASTQLSPTGLWPFATPYHRLCLASLLCFPCHQLGTVTSSVASVTVSTQTSTTPTITVNPVDTVAPVGSAATFTVQATSSSGAITYQWFRTGSGTQGAVSGATSATYTLVTVTGECRAAPIGPHVHPSVRTASPLHACASRIRVPPPSCHALPSLRLPPPSSHHHWTLLTVWSLLLMRR